MQTRQFVVRDVVTVSPDADVAAAARLMREKHVGFLVVTDQRNGGQYPIGVLTDRDIVMESVAENENPHNLKVSDVMTTRPLVAVLDELVEELLPRMRAAGVRRAPVVDNTGALAGVIAFDDVLQVLADALRNMAGLVARQRVTETTMRA